MSPLVQLLAAEGLSPDHPAAVEAEAAAQAASPAIVDPALEDLTRLAFCTIDEVESRDLDQAVFVAPDGTGHRLWYALADAAHYVRPGTALWNEALRRGTSFYLPGLVAPMLPRVLSEDVVSLLPQVDRRALVFELALDANGRCTATTVHRARVRSRAKLDFGGVQAYFDGAGRIADAAVEASLQAMAVVGRRRMVLAEERAVVRYRRRELHVGRLAGDDLRFVAVEDLRRDVERWNEQVSVLCNMEGARLLAGRGQAIYRVHEPPTVRATEELVGRIEGIAVEWGLPATWRWRPDAETLASYLDRLPENGEKGRISAAIHRQAILSNGEASFTATPGAHHALGAEAYGRFTAPMREIVGIFLHRELLPEGATDDDSALRDAVIEAGNRARKVQGRLDRAVNRLVLDQLLGDALAAGTTLRGTILGVTPAKVHVRLDEPPVDVKVYAEHLARHPGPAPRIGAGTSVRVVRRDPQRDRWELALEPLK
ncbi:MAG: RNB domain-containing ribonuclease [Deltaproteobacteria bacterium]|nr:RNB domain-containing ribonuclease [Deltaproteobacteria bacterium]